MTDTRLPDVPFLICVGVEKCGTTSLFGVMQDDAFSRTRHKESFFFNRDFEQGPDVYRAQFDDQLEDNTRVHVDFTPSYFRSEKVLQRISDSCPGAKILLCVRNPLRRAYSFYQHVYRNHHATGAWSKNFGGRNIYFFDAAVEREVDYFLVDYHRVLTGLETRFGQESVAVVFLEDLIGDWVATARRLDRFLGFDTAVLARQAGLPRENESTLLPYFFREFKSGDELWLAQAHGDKVRFFTGLTQKQVSNALVLQGSVTQHLTPAIVESLIPKISDSVHRLADRTGRDLSDWLEPFAAEVRFTEVGAIHLEQVEAFLKSPAASDTDAGTAIG